jgi:hypothetical protein
MNDELPQRTEPSNQPHGNSNETSRALSTAVYQTSTLINQRVNEFYDIDTRGIARFNPP